MADEPEKHGVAWSVEEEQKLYDAFVAGKNIAVIAKMHERKTGGIRSALQKLGLLDELGTAVSPAPEFTPSPAALKKQLKDVANPKRQSVVPVEEVKPFTPIQNENFKHALHLMEDTAQNLFITGKAGTGKSTLLSYFCRTTQKRPVVLAPTGVAALHVKGQTIHSFFNFYVDVTPEKIRAKKGKPRQAKLFKKLKTIVIDEISMVRADLLDCVDTFLRLHGPDGKKPFGGVQMIFIGDLYQLPPVVNSQEKEFFSTHYETPYFFSAHALQEAELELVELDKVYRQKDQGFVDLLNKIRNNTASEKDLEHLNSRLLKEAPVDSDFSITLTTTNAVADGINETRLHALKGRAHSAAARVEGEFGKEYFPTTPQLAYKTGAQIMLLNNDTEKRWVNGSIGVIEAQKTDHDGDEYLAVRLQDTKSIVDVYPHTWEVYRFGLEDGRVMPTPAGTFTQYPFRLAWAITIHKSQGKTFTRAVIDTGRGAFAAGQMYVALSRCTSFEGLALKTPIRASDIRTDRRITGFIDSFASGGMSADEKTALIRSAIAENAALDIVYRKADNAQTACTVTPIKLSTATYQGESYDGMRALADDEERLFRVDRILKIARAS